MKQPYILLTINFFFLTLSATLPESPQLIQGVVQGVPLSSAQIQNNKITLSPQQSMVLLALMAKKADDSDSDSDDE